jgi:gamma-glutamylcyclotransferase (GGCT)/AIG2-like uncharacterized protein YtfP
VSKQTYPILYAAYGANTNRAHMATRCPTAVYVGNIILHDYKLAFRGVADVVPAKGRGVECALWEIYENDEASLDRFEGYPHHYTKHYAKMQYRGKSRTIMFYVMAGKRHDVHEPPYSYERTLREGYEACGLRGAQIDEAIRECDSHKRRKTYFGKWVRQDAAERGKGKAKRVLSPEDQLDLWAAENLSWGYNVDWSALTKRGLA